MLKAPDGISGFKFSNYCTKYFKGVNDITIAKFVMSLVFYKTINPHVYIKYVIFHIKI